MEKLLNEVPEIEVITVSSGSVIVIEFFNNTLILGQPYVTGLIGILTCIYLLKKILFRDKKSN